MRALAQLAHERLGETPMEARLAPVAAKSAALRELAEAAGLYEPGEVTQDYARLLMQLEQAVQFDPATEDVDDVPVPLPSGRSVRMGAPLGAGRIALWGDAIGMLVNMHGEDSPRLIEPLTEFSCVLGRHNDLRQLAHVTRWTARLTAAALGGAHPVARGAAEGAGAAAENLGIVVGHLRSENPGKGAGWEPDAAAVQRAAVALREAGRFGRRTGREVLEHVLRHRRRTVSARALPRRR